MKKVTIILLAILMMSFTFSACANKNVETDVATTNNESNSSILNTEIETYEGSYDIGDAIIINLNEEKGETVNITYGGTYELTGNYTGQIYVNAADDDKVKIVLNNVNIETDTTACIYVVNAKNVIVSSADNSVNNLVCTGTFVQIDDKKIDGAIFAREDIQISGHGTLNISCETGHGIVAKDDFKMKNATVNITSNKKGIEVNDAFYMESGNLTIISNGEGIEAFSITIDDGLINITSGDDGINATGGDQSEPGSGLSADVLSFVLINGGNITIDSVGDGIDSNGYIEFNGGTLTIAKPDNKDDECLDYESTFTNNGGTLSIEDNSDIEQMMVGGINSQPTTNGPNPNNMPMDANQGGMQKPDFAPGNQM